MKNGEAPIKGVFVESLKRTSSQIKGDRAIAIAEDAETAYRRYIEDLQAKLKSLKRKRQGTLDLSPTDINSLVAGKDFDGGRFVVEDTKAGIEIRNLKIKIQDAQDRYEELFGDGKVDEGALSEGIVEENSIN